MDLFELDNLRVALLNVLNKALDKNTVSEFPKEIRASGTRINNLLNSLRKNLANNWSEELSKTKLSEEEAEEEKLWYTYKALKEIHEIILAETTIAATFFAKFIYGMMVANRVAFLRIVAAKIMKASKEEIEIATQKTTKKC